MEVNNQKQDRPRPVVFLLLLALLPLPWTGLLSVKPLVAEGQETSRMVIDVNPEDRDVGLKRMEILDKALTPEIIRKKNAYVRMKEEDYNRKIAELLQRLTTPIGNNTVVTHIDVDFLDPGFDKQVQARESVHVTILLDRDGFSKWAKGKPSDEEAKNQMTDLLSAAFHIPKDNISIVIAPN